MAKDDEDDLLPDKDAAKGFYAKYEPKEILGRYVHILTRSKIRNSCLYCYRQLIAFKLSIMNLAWLQI